MPIYSYKCMRCGKVTDKYMRMNERRKAMPCECGGLATRSFTDELAKPQLFEEYWDMHLANDDYPHGRKLTGHRQKAEAMKEMGFGMKEGGPGWKMNKKEREAWRHKIPLKKHFLGLNNKLKARNISYDA